MTEALGPKSARATLIVEQPELATLVVSGPDRKTWLNGLVTCDVVNLEPGQGAFGLALTKQGKIVSDLNVVAAEGELYVSGAPGTPLFHVLEAFLIMEDANLVERSNEFTWLMLHGPQAGLLGERARQRQQPAATIDWTGLGGAAIVVRRAAVKELVRELLTATGAAVVTGSVEDFEGLRIERGLPRFGVDYDSRDNPHDASLERRAVSWSKGCYLGQEVVCMQDMRGKPKRRLLTLEVAAEKPPVSGTPVMSGDEEVGKVTSSARSRSGGKTVVMARLAARAVREGELSVAGHRAERVQREA